MNSFRYFIGSSIVGVILLVSPMFVFAGAIPCNGTTPEAIAQCEQTCIQNGGTPSSAGTGSCAMPDSPGSGLNSPGGQGSQGSGNPQGSQGSGNPQDPQATVFEPVFLQNPLAGSVDDIPSFIKELLQIALIIGTPLVVLAIIYAGFLLVAAQGNPEKLEKAKSALLWAVIGGAVLLGSYVIAQAIGATIEQITG